MDVDLGRPGGGLYAIRAIKAELPAVKIVMLASFDGDKKLDEAAKMGVSGCLRKNLDAEELFAVLDALDGRS